MGTSPASPSPSRPLVAIVGPTASGKSQLALSLAQAFRGEIVNADSRQVYRLMDVGTAKPPAALREQVPHHLYDVVAPDQGFSLAQFLQHATQAIAGIHLRGRLPLVVGGTGQYIWALLEGWQAPRVAPNPALRQRLEAEAQQDGVATLYARLQQVDPEAAAGIHPHNLRRIIRALEVQGQTGVPFSRQRQRVPPPYRTLVLGISVPRPELYQCIDRRVEEMLRQGWLEEVRHLLAQGYSPDLPALSSIGYRELVAHLQGKLPLEEAVQRIRYATHRLARRQAAWFHAGDPRICWLDAGPAANPPAHAQVAALLSEGSAPCATPVLQ